LLGHEYCPEQEIAALYQERWKIEVKFRDIKTTLGYEHCRTRTTEMAEKTMRMVFATYNLIKAVQRESIADQPYVLDDRSFKQTIDAVSAARLRFRG